MVGATLTLRVKFMTTPSKAIRSQGWLLLASLGLCTSAALAQENAADLWRKALAAPAQAQASEKAASQAKVLPAEQAKSATTEVAAEVKAGVNADAPADVKAAPSSAGKPQDKAQTPSADELAKKSADAATSEQTPLPKEQARLAQEREAKELRRSNLSVKRQDAQARGKEAQMQDQTSLSEQAQRLGKDAEVSKQAAAHGNDSTAQQVKNLDKALKSGKSQKTEKSDKANELESVASDVEKAAKDAKAQVKAGAEQSVEKSADKDQSKAAAGKDIFVLPYQPGEGAQLAMQATQAWVEVYAVDAKDSDKALQTLLSQETPPALGVVADDTFYASTAQGEFEAPIAGYLVTRKGKELAYDVDCNVVPQKGDELRADFTSGPLQVRLQGKLTAHFVFGAKNIFSDEIVRLPGLTAENCHLVDEQRLVYQGKVTVSKDGKPVSSRDVVFQSITPQ